MCDVSGSRRFILCVVAVATMLLLFTQLSPTPARSSVDDDEARLPVTGEQLFLENCSGCHGFDGRGSPPSRVGFEQPLPDFTECTFATREPTVDWVGVATEGGPTRGFSPIMPAFGDALTYAELERTVDHIRTFCDNRWWPPGDLNFPRPMFTTKAFPEDEFVLTTGVTTESPIRVLQSFTYEKRIGACSQFEAIIPWTWGLEEGGTGNWTGGLTDMAFAFKSTPVYSLSSGTVLAFAAELVIPTGDEDKNFGTGTTVFEPMLMVGQSLGEGGFLQFQGGFVLPFIPRKLNRGVFWRLVYGRTFTQGPFGRAWTPMVELLGATALAGGDEVAWTVVPQLQLTLNTRQHVSANFAARIPVDSIEWRQPTLYFYLMWEFFDGAFLEGW